MTRPPAGQVQEVLDQVATILRAASRLATQLRRTTQASANAAVDLEAAIGRALAALRRLESPAGRRRTR